MADSNRDGQDKKFQISNLELAFPVLILSIPINFSFCKRSRAWECGPRGDAFRFGGGEDEAEARAAPRHALDLDVAAVLCEHLPDDDEAEARAASARLRRVERVEDVRAHVLG